MSARPRCAPRGTTLVEAVVALAVLSLGVVGVARWQSDLWHSADLAAERSQALRLAARELERVRAADPADLVGEHAAQTTIDATVYRSERHAVEDATAPLLAWVRVAVAWIDRRGSAHAVTLSTAASRAPAALSGALALPPDPAAGARVRGRAPVVPATARDLGDGHSTVRPTIEAPVSFVVDNGSGRVVARCTEAGPCTSIDGLPVSGWIRVSLATPPDAAHPDDTPLPLRIAWQLTQGRLLEPGCLAERREGALAYYCVIAPQDGGWSGRSDIVPLPGAAPPWRVCRYVPAAAQASGNAGHPERYDHVDRPLMQQNFLVIRAGQACPVAPPSPVLPDGLVTVAHEP